MCDTLQTLSASSGASSPLPAEVFLLKTLPPPQLQPFFVFSLLPWENPPPVTPPAWGPEGQREADGSSEEVRTGTAPLRGSTCAGVSSS